MADTVTLESLDKKIDKAVDDLSDIIQSFVQHVDERFNKVEVELSNVKQDTADLKASHDKLLNTLDHFLKRLDDIETDNTARDAQFARLERWIEQLADKTGLKLEY
jgi:FtsZ-binding cell division protein ZapB